MNIIKSFLYQCYTILTLNKITPTNRLIILLIALFIGGGSITWAQTGGGYDLSWHTIAGGGGISSNGSYVAAGTIGQTAVGHSNGGAFEVSSGFWAVFPSQTGSMPYKVYLPGVIR